MVTLQNLIDLSPDDDEAFVAFEAVCRQAVDEAGVDRDNALIEYMTLVQGASEEYGVDPERQLQREDSKALSRLDYSWFSQAALKLVTRLKVRTAKRANVVTIELAPADKTKIRAEVERLRNRVEAATDIDVRRKRAIMQRLDDILKEIEKPRANHGAVLVMLAAIVPLVGQAQDVVVKLPETIVAVMDVIGVVAGEEEERRAILQRWREPKAIEHRPARTDDASQGDAGATGEAIAPYELDRGSQA